MNGKKIRSHRVSRRLGRKRFRAAEKRIIRGDRNHSTHFSDSWSGVPGMRQNNLPA